MRVRRFTKASAESVRFPVVAANNLAGGNISIAAIVKLVANAAGSGEPLIIPATSGSAWAGPGLLILITSNLLQLSTDGNVQNSNSVFTVTTADDWVLVGADKASGTTTPRMHKCRLQTGEWRHENGSAAITDGAAPGLTGTWQVGQWPGIENAGIWVALCAVWPRRLSEAEWEQLKTLQGFIDSGAVFLPVFDQSAVADTVRDLAKNSNESARTGTTCFAESLHRFEDLPPSMPLGALLGQVSLQAALSGVGSLTAAIKRDEKLAAVISALATLGVGLKRDEKLQVSIAGVAAVTAALKRDRRLQALVAGGAQLTSAARLDEKIQAVLSGQATVLAVLTTDTGAAAVVIKDVDQTVHIVSMLR